MGTGDDLDPVPDAGGQAVRVPGDDAYGLVLREQILYYLVADGAGRCGYHDHGSSLGPYRESLKDRSALD